MSGASIRTGVNLSLDNFKNQNILVVGGAGFVGSNLVKMLLKSSPNRVVIVDNLLSAERSNVPPDPSVTLLEGSITDDRILASLKDDFDYVFHLATYHGNQSSIHDPLADHENNADDAETPRTSKDSKGLRRLFIPRRLHRSGKDL